MYINRKTNKQFTNIPAEMSQIEMTPQKQQPENIDTQTLSTKPDTYLDNEIETVVKPPQYILGNQIMRPSTSGSNAF